VEKNDFTNIDTTTDMIL